MCTRSRRFVLDGKPVFLSVSSLPAELVAGSAITREDTGPGGTYARLAELGRKPVRFREEVRSRMPMAAEARQLALSPGTPVIRICRTAFDADGGAVEVNEMMLDAAKKPTHRPPDAPPPGAPPRGAGRHDHVRAVKRTR